MREITNHELLMFYYYCSAVQQHNNIDTTSTHERYSLLASKNINFTGNVDNHCSNVSKNINNSTFRIFARQTHHIQHDIQHNVMILPANAR